MRPHLPGDKVICIDPPNDSFKKGEIYIVEKYKGMSLGVGVIPEFLGNIDAESADIQGKIINHPNVYYKFKRYNPIKRTISWL